MKSSSNIEHCTLTWKISYINSNTNLKILTPFLQPKQSSEPETRVACKSSESNQVLKSTKFNFVTTSNGQDCWFESKWFTHNIVVNNNTQF